MLRVLAVLAAAAITLTLLPATAQSQEEDDQEFDFDPTAACPVDAPESDFSDRDDVVPEDHVQNVDCGAYFDIVLGFEDGTFGPSMPVRRDQMASFIARTLDAADVELPAATEGRDFTDVGDGNVHQDNIRRLEAAGITLGGPLGAPEDEFGPDHSIRRDQMMSFIVRASEWAYDEDFASNDQQFDDVPEANVHFENVNFAAETGLTVGQEDGTFGPGEATRRDQTSAFVMRLLNFLITPAEVDITEQSAETATVGESITVTATVFSQFRDEAEDTASTTDTATLAGEDVHFTVEHADDPGVTTPAETETVQTNEDGEASFDFTGSEPGTVTVTATVDGPGGHFVHADGDGDSAQKEFVVDPDVGPVETPGDGDGDGDGEGVPSVLEAARRATATGVAGKKVEVTWSQAVVPGANNPHGYKLYTDDDCTTAVNTGVAREPASAAVDEVVIEFTSPIAGGDRWLGVDPDTERDADDDTPNAEECFPVGSPST